MTELSTRLAEPGDADRIAPLFDAYRCFYGKAADPALCLRFIGDRLRKRESAIWIATLDAELVGFCQLYPTFCSVAGGRIFVLYDLFVSPAVRGKGAGRALMRAAEGYARAEGALRMDLSTAKTNAAARSLYESLGWVRDDIFYVYNKPLA